MDYSSNLVSFTDSTANKVLSLLQVFFHYSTVETITIMPKLIAAIKPLQSVQQLFFISKLLAPFIYRISPNSKLSGQVYKFNFYFRSINFF
jgi:hypothetical protein